MKPFSVAAIAACLLAIIPASSLRAVMIDEIQVYDDSVNDPGRPGLELHLNTTLHGRSDQDYPGEITPQHGIRLTPEFSYGMGHGLEAGLYLPTERSREGAIDSAGVKVRLKWVPVRPGENAAGWFAGANGELSRLAPRFEQGKWSFEWRTMLGYHAPDWIVAVNPVFGWTLGGPERSGRPEEELQIKAAHKVAPGISFGPEYYGDFGRVGRPDRFESQDHALFAAFDVDLKPWVFNVGIGHGLSHAADRWTLKFIFEVPW